MKSALVYPNQLFENHPCLSRNRKILLIQDPLFFGDQQYPMLFHKQKILLHYLSMDSFRDNLIKRGYDVEIVLYENLRSKGYTQTIIKKYQLSEVHIANVVDYTLEKRIKAAAQELDVRIYCCLLYTSQSPRD